MADEKEKVDPVLLQEACAAHADATFYSQAIDEANREANRTLSIAPLRRVDHYDELLVESMHKAYTKMTEADPELKAAREEMIEESLKPAPNRAVEEQIIDNLRVMDRAFSQRVKDALDRRCGSVS